MGVDVESVPERDMKLDIAREILAHRRELEEEYPVEYVADVYQEVGTQ